MILECPECGKRYLVDPRSVGLAGRVVRCAGCKHEWHAELSDEVRAALLEKQAEEERNKAAAEMAAIDAETEEAQERRRKMRQASSANVPALARDPFATPFGLKLATMALGVVFLVISLVYFRPMIVAAAPFAEALYQRVGLYNSDGVVLAEIAYERREIGTKDNHQFSGYLVNTSSEIRRLPALRLRLMGAEQQVIKNRTLKEVLELPPGEKKAFRTAIDSSPGSAALVVVEHGNGMELKLRAKPNQSHNKTQEDTDHDGQ